MGAEEDSVWGASLTGLTLSAATGFEPFDPAALPFTFRYLRIVGENGAVNLRAPDRLESRKCRKEEPYDVRLDTFLPDFGVFFEDLPTDLTNSRVGIASGILDY